MPSLMATILPEWIFSAGDFDRGAVPVSPGEGIRPIVPVSAQRGL